MKQLQSLLASLSQMIASHVTLFGKGKIGAANFAKLKIKSESNII